MSIDTEVVEGAYCALSNLRVGDLTLPSYMGDGSSYIKEAADEIDAALGHLYKTPIDFKNEQGEVPLTARPALLTLKKMNWLIASGRMVLELSQSSENQNQHAYGLAMLNEGLLTLKGIVDGDIRLVGANPIEEGPGSTAPGDFTGPAVFNEDPDSLVKSFYERRSPLQTQATPYGLPQPYYRGLI